LAIDLSRSAVDEVLRLRAKQQLPSARFRLAVESGGCNGLFYVMKFDEVVGPEDRTYDFEDLQMIVDRQSLSYIDGLTLDYSEDLMGGGFRFHNPNALQSCGCGHSFSISEGDDGQDCQG